MSSKIYNFLPASLLVILVVSVLLAAGYIKSSTRALIQFGEEYNIVLGRVVANSMKKKLIEVLRVHASRHESAEQANNSAILDEVVHVIGELISNTPIVWVRMYDENHSMVISTGPLSMLATERYGVWQSALSDGVVSKLRVYRDEYKAGGIEREFNVIESYIPFIWDDNGETFKGTFEIYSDVNGFKKSLYIKPLFVITVTFSIMAILYAAIIALYRKTLRDMKWRGSVRKREDLLEQVSSRFIEAQEEERKRIGRDIHDEAGQWLSVLKFRLEALAQTGKHDSLERENEIEKLLELVQKSISSIRNVVIQLRPSILDDLGLCPAVSWLVRTSNDSLPRLNIDLNMDIGEHNISPSLKTTIFRVIQEALSNMGRHSMAHQGKVTLYKRGRRISLEIRDDGQGFDPVSVCQDRSGDCGFGLINMRERTEVAGGEFRILTTPGKGTVISAAWDTPK